MGDMDVDYSDNEFVKEKFLQGLFKSKLNSSEALPIRKQLVDFYKDFEQKSKMNLFTNPDEQSQYLRTFLTEISSALINNQLWINAETAEKEHALKEMERAVTTRYYDMIFCTNDDLNEDALLSHKIHMHSWVEPRHFNLPDLDYHIFDKAGNELSKMNNYKFYIDKITFIVNCMVFIEDAYRKNVSFKETFTQEDLLILLIFTILKTNPEMLISNCQYIMRYGSPNYFNVHIDALNCSIQEILNILVKSIEFIIYISQTSILNITPEEYDTKINEITRVLIGPTDNGLFTDNRGGFIQPVLDLFEKITNTSTDYPSLGLFAHISSVQSSSSVNKSLSALSSHVLEYKEELREKYLSNQANEPVTRPFENDLIEEEQNVLVQTDQELNKQLSISSNKEENN